MKGEVPVGRWGTVLCYSSIMTPEISTKHPNNKFQGKTLQMMLEELVAHYGWEKLASHIKINCFGTDPSIASSLKFLRRTPWARKKVDALYLHAPFHRAKKD